MAAEPEDGLQPAVSRDQPRGAAAPERGGAGHAAALSPPRPAHGAQRGPGPVQEPLPGDNILATEEAFIIALSISFLVQRVLQLRGDQHCPASGGSSATNMPSLVILHNILQ